RSGLWSLLILCACLVLRVTLPAQSLRLPTHLVSAPTLAVPGRVDSSVPMLWTRIDGVLTLVAFASWGGVPVRMAGPNLEGLQVTGGVALDPFPLNGVWFE